MVRPVRTTVPAGAGNDQEVFAEKCVKFIRIIKQRTWADEVWSCVTDT